MNLAKVFELSSYLSFNKEKYTGSKESRSKSKQTQKSKADELNDVLDKYCVGIIIREVEGELYYVDSKSGNLLAKFIESEFDVFIDNIKTSESELQKQLTYDKQYPSGNFLDMDI